jgi:hypothetical protein
VFAYGQLCIDVMQKAASHQSRSMSIDSSLGASSGARRRKVLGAMRALSPRGGVTRVGRRSAREILTAAKAGLLRDH